MSYTQGTEHYDFPQIVGSDRPTFVDFNAAFRTIDTKLYGLEGDASTVDGRLDTIEAALPVMDAATQSAQNTADSAKAEADTNAEHITALEVLTGQHTTQIANKLDSVAIAEQYDPNAGTYAVDDIVVYNGQRYKCVTAVAVAEPFDADKWIGEDVQTVLESINTELSDVLHFDTTSLLSTNAVMADYQDIDISGYRGLYLYLIAGNPYVRTTQILPINQIGSSDINFIMNLFWDVSDKVEIAVAVSRTHIKLYDANASGSYTNWTCRVYGIK